MSLNIKLVCESCKHTHASASFSHNATQVWKASGCYDALYSSHGKKAKETLEAVTQAILAIASDIRGYDIITKGGYITAKECISYLQEWQVCLASNPEMTIRVSR